MDHHHASKTLRPCGRHHASNLCSTCQYRCLMVSEAELCRGNPRTSRIAARALTLTRTRQQFWRRHPSAKPAALEQLRRSPSGCSGAVAPTARQTACSNITTPDPEQPDVEMLGSPCCALYRLLIHLFEPPPALFAFRSTFVRVLSFLRLVNGSGVQRARGFPTTSQTLRKSRPLGGARLASASKRDLDRHPGRVDLMIASLLARAPYTGSQHSGGSVKSGLTSRLSIVRPGSTFHRDAFVSRTMSQARGRRSPPVSDSDVPTRG